VQYHAGVSEPTTRVTPLRWDDGLWLLDQRRLPWREEWVRVRDVGHAVRLIRSLAVRGAPAIGIAAAYALAAEAKRCSAIHSLRRAADRLATARPTATNLARAVAGVLAAVEAAPGHERAAAALVAARQQHEDDAEACRQIARHGAALFSPGRVTLLTHCNTGALATGGIGTALGIVRAIHSEGRLAMLYACEARPVLQGSRLTAWECVQDGIPVTLLPDHAAAGLLASGAVDGVVLGADRIAADGSVANKLGTYSLALAAAASGVTFVSAAPTTTFDLGCPSGSSIPIEQRDPGEVLTLLGRRLAPHGVAVFNPAFDVTPPHLLSAIVSERGVARPVTAESIARIAR
jgi:methylthioribose-1-phosphate isomerase